MAQLEHIEAIEKRLWTAADTLRANSNYASNEYFLPVMGLIFLRHAYSRFLGVKDTIEANLPKRGGKAHPLSKEDFSQKSAIFLQPKAQFDYLVALNDSDDRAQAIIDAMEPIENDYTNLNGVLPKNEYQELDNSVLGQLLSTLNPEELKHVSGDVFGRIYEYFLTQFADQKAHDGGEFFTPVSLVSLIAKVLEPEGGTVLDPACGSGGMFVQSARFVEMQHQNPGSRLTFRGLEKNATTIRLAKMNLAVHGLEGDILKAITYYNDPHELLGKADFVMANPPFNVDEIDADKVLMIDARNIYRKVTRKIFDFSPEQEQDILAIVWLYRGETNKYLDLVAGYCQQMLIEAKGCFTTQDVNDTQIEPLPFFIASLDKLREALHPFLKTLPKDAPHTAAMKELDEAIDIFKPDVDTFAQQQDLWKKQKINNGELKKAVERLEPLVEASRDLVKQLDMLYKFASRLIETCENECSARDNDAWINKEITRGRKAADESRQLAVEQLKQVRYFHRHAHWLTERFPEARLCDVEGLVKLVDRSEIEANDWSLTPGRYVGVAPEEEDENFDFEETLREIHTELEDLNTEAVQLAATIKKNFEELGI